jgi:hypothetical protein
MNRLLGPMLGVGRVCLAMSLTGEKYTVAFLARQLLSREEKNAKTLDGLGAYRVAERALA